MLAEIVVEAIGAVGRVLVGTLLKGPGYAVLRLFKHRDTEFERGGLATVVDAFVWAASL